MKNTILLFLISCCLAACDCKDCGPVVGEISEVLPPVVTSPEAKQTASMDYTLTPDQRFMVEITFDRPMDTTSVMPGMTLLFSIPELDQFFSGAVRWQTDSSLTFTSVPLPSPCLSPDAHSLQLTIRGSRQAPSVADAQGVALDGEVDGQPGGDFTTAFRGIADIEPPVCVPPSDLVVDCSELPPEFDPADDTQLSVLFGAPQATDNCTALAEQIDKTINLVCNSGTIVRTFEAEDEQGLTSQNPCRQTITIVTTEGPLFDLPADIVVDCSQADILSITGIPGNFSKICGSSIPEVDFIDMITPGVCQFSYTIRRTWMVSYKCGQISEKDQIIDVVDRQVPNIIKAAQDETISCSQGIDADQAFSEWISRLGGATAVDNCSETKDLSWETFNTGTGNPPSLGVINCSSAEGVLRSQAVDFVVTDECGRKGVTSATFRLIDDQPPVISGCPASFSIPSDPGSLEADILLSPPVIEEACYIAAGSENANASATVTSQATPGQESETPVDPLVLQFDLSGNKPVNAAGDGKLTIDLLDVDGEQPTEFFNILGEDGSLFGITQATDVQCGNSTSVFTIPAATLNEWAMDGQITIRLEPNIPVGFAGTFSINQLCMPAGTVNGNLSFDTKLFSEIIFAYRIDGINEVTVVDPIAPFPITLPEGNHQVTYFATDCAGNTDSCVFEISVENAGPACCIKGTITDWNSLPVANVEVNVTGSESLQTATAADGFYQFTNLIEKKDYTVRPARNDDPLNGLSNLDVTLLIDHLTGTNPLTNPYQLIAADLDNSGNITTADLFLLQQLISGAITELSDNTSWRFVNACYQFPDVSNPWAEPFPEFENYNLVQDCTDGCGFIGIKIGDLNGTAMSARAPVEGESSPRLLTDRPLPLDESIHLEQNRPNPWSGRTFIGFYLPQAGAVQLTVWDVNGRILERIPAQLGRGYHRMELNGERLGAAPGVLYYTLESSGFRETKRMVWLGGGMFHYGQK